MGRAKFSLSLARAIYNLAVAKDGFVIAVMGEWGSGKSSVVEMICRFLTHLEMEALSEASDPQTLESLEVLAEAFDPIRGRVEDFDQRNLHFSMAEITYRRTLFRKWLDDDENAQRADRYFNLLKQVRQKPKTIQIRFSPWLISGRAQLTSAFLSELARALGEKLGAEVRDSFAKLLERLSEFAPMAGAGLDFATGIGVGRLVASGATWSGKFAAKLTAGQTLEELRERLRWSLKRLPDQRVLVIIDDLDRLTANEAVEMVSLVKSVGDLPNVIYLLSFDRDNLVRLLQEATKLDGSDFLEKIVQYPVHLPPIKGRGLTNLLDADLAEILGPLDPVQTRRVGRTWYSAFRHYLKTPRDVRLYANSVAVSMSAQKDFADRIDLLLLELLRLHEPDVYLWLREHLDEMTE